MFIDSYEGWYTESRRVIEQLVPERLQDFTSLYRLPGARKERSTDNYRIVDYLRGSDISVPFSLDSISFSATRVTQNLFGNQAKILESASKRVTSSLMEIKEVLAADLFLIQKSTKPAPCSKISYYAKQELSPV